MVDSIHHGDMAMAGEAFTADGMILSGIHFILTGDHGVQVGVVAGPTAVAGVTAEAGAMAEAGASVSDLVAAMDMAVSITHGITTTTILTIMIV